MELLMKNYCKKFKKEFKEVQKLIEEYDNIAIFRHVIPDFDALGTQIGLGEYLKTIYPNKNIKLLGEDHRSFTPSLYKEMDIVDDEWFNKPFLAIIVDCGNTKRIDDQRYLKANKIVKFDHHPNVENFSDVTMVDTSLASCAELVTCFLYSIAKNDCIGYNASKNLYSGLVGDSGRFLYSSTSALSFEVAKKLIQEGILINPIYKVMYEKDIDSLNILGYILNHYKISPHGVAYFVLTKEIATKLGMEDISGKEYVNTFSNIKGIEIWCSVAEDTDNNCFRVSIRSKKVAINDVASKWEGGGHAQASGATLQTLDVLDDFINDLDAKLI